MQECERVRAVVPNLSNIATPFRTSNHEATPILKISYIGTFIFCIKIFHILRLIREITVHSVNNEYTQEVVQSLSHQ